MASHNQQPIVVVKYGGNAIADEQSLLVFAQSIAKLKAMGHHVVVVHGGGPQINYWLDKTHTQSHFVDGQRYTDTDTLAIVEMVLCAQVNKAIVRACSANHLNAVGISGQDANLICAKPQPKLGMVGNVDSINPAIITHLLAGDYLPVVAPLGLNKAYQTLNINADFSAAHIAGALSAEHFILMTNVDGILDANQQRLPILTSKDIEHLIEGGVIYGGMLPKIACAQTALQANCKQVSIINGLDPSNLIRAFTHPDSIGSRITL